MRTGVSAKAGGVLTGVPGQGVVGARTGEAEALGDLAGAAGPAQQLGRLDLGPELGTDDAQQHDGRGLLAPLLVRRAHLLGLGEPGQAAWTRGKPTHERVGILQRQKMNRLPQKIPTEQTSAVSL